MARTSTDKNMTATMDASAEVLPGGPENIALPEKNETPEHYGQEVMMQAEFAKSDAETSFAFYNKNPQFQSEQFTSIHEGAKTQLNTAWVGLQTGVKEVLEPPQATPPVATENPINKQPDAVMQTNETAPDSNVIELKPLVEEPKRRPKLKYTIPVEGNTPEAVSIPVDVVPTKVDVAPVAEIIIPKTDKTDKTEELKPVKRGRPKKVIPEPELAPAGIIGGAQENLAEPVAGESVIDKTPLPETRPVAKVATPEEIRTNGKGMYNPEVIIPGQPTTTAAEKQKMETWVNNLNNVVDDTRMPGTRDYNVDDKLTEAVKERLLSVQKRDEEYRRKKAERAGIPTAEAIAMSPEKKQFLEQQEKADPYAAEREKMGRAYEAAKQAAERAENREKTGGLTLKDKIFNKVLNSKVFSSMRGFVERLQVSHESAKVEKLSQKTSEATAELEANKKFLAMAQTPEERNKFQEKVTTYENELAKLRGKYEKYAGTVNERVDKRTINIEKHMSVATREMVSLKKNIDGLATTIQKYTDFRNAKATEHNELLNRTKGTAVQMAIQPRLYQLQAEMKKADKFLDKYQAKYNAYKVKYSKAEGVAKSFEVKRDEFAGLKQTI